MILALKSFIKKFFRILNLEISLYKNSKSLIDNEYFIPFNKKDIDSKLYDLGLEKSENQKSDNIYKHLRFYSLIQLVRQVINKKINGDFVECGCWRGHSSNIISEIISKSNRNINFHIFDSFEGLSEFVIEDQNFFYSNKEDKKNISKHFDSSELFVKDKVLGKFDFVKTYKGWIPKRFNEVKNLSFSLVHIDVDLYEPTLASLEFFYPRLSKGGIIICDDYNVSAYPGSKKAWDEFFDDKDYEFFYKVPMGACFIVK